jgi:hypothetical protein
MKSLHVLLSTLAVIIVAAALTVGCGDGDIIVTGPDGGLPDTTGTLTPPDTGTPPDTSTNPDEASLVLEDGYAWIFQVEDGFLGTSQGGYVFNEDGTCIILAFTFDMWLSSESEWFVVGDKIGVRDKTYRLCYNGECETIEEVSVYTYSFSAGGKLILIDDDDDTLEFTKTQLNLGVVPEYDEDLVNTYWADAETGAVWMFQVEGPMAIAFHAVVDEDGEPVEEPEMYTWHTLSGKLHLTPFSIVGPGGDKVVYDYSVSGEELTVDGVKYTKQDIPDEDDDEWLFKARAKKALEKKLGKKLGKVSLLK